MNGPPSSLRNRLTISLLSAIIVSLGVSICGWWWQASLHQQANRQLQSAAQAREAVLSLNVAFLTAHRHDSSLLELAYRNQPIEPFTIVAYTTALQDARQAFANLEALNAVMPALVPHTSQINRLLGKYQATFNQISNQLEQRRRINGIEYQLREARRALWLTLEQHDGELRERGLRLALEEQAYLTTHRQEYIDGVRLQINQLRAGISGLPDRERNALEQSATAYLQAFLQLVELDRELQRYTVTLQYHIDDILHTIASLQQVIEHEQERATATHHLAVWAGYGVIIWMIGSSIAIFLALGWFFNHYISRPLTTLTFAAKRVASGWRETPIPIIGTDEIGDLARALARLTDELNEMIAKLEDRVTQRTIQLQRALAENEALLARERRRNRSEQVLIDLSLALNNLVDEAAIYRCVVDMLATGKEPEDQIGVYTREPEGTGWLPQASHGYHDSSWKLIVPPALKQPRASPLYIADLSSYQIENFPCGQGSAVVALIHLNAQLHALLILYRPQTNAFTEDEIAYVGIAARLASQAITHARLVTSLQQAKEAAEAINRERSAFLARLDYDVRNPLNTIIAIGEMLREALADRPPLPMTPTQLFAPDAACWHGLISSSIAQRSKLAGWLCNQNPSRSTSCSMMC